MENENVIQYADDDGSFRIFHQGLGSNWTPYAHIATLHIGNDIYIGVTDYYRGYLPVDTVMKVTELPTIDYLDQ